MTRDPLWKVVFAAFNVERSYYVRAPFKCHDIAVDLAREEWRDEWGDTTPKLVSVECPGDGERVLK